MIGSVRGAIIAQGRGWVVVETPAGLGYRVWAKEGKAIGEAVQFFTHEHIREDSDELWGFATLEELGIFQSLLGVSGVGPKVASAIVFAAPPEAITEAIMGSDPTLFTTISGVGKKVAMKIVVELRPRLAQKEADFVQLNQAREPLVQALLGLGYKKAEVAPLLASIDKSATLDAQLKYALKMLSRTSR